MSDADRRTFLASLGLTPEEIEKLVPPYQVTGTVTVDVAKAQSKTGFLKSMLPLVPQYTPPPSDSAVGTAMKGGKAGDVIPVLLGNSVYNTALKGGVDIGQSVSVLDGLPIAKVDTGPPFPKPLTEVWWRKVYLDAYNYLPNINEVLAEHLKWLKEIYAARSEPDLCDQYAEDAYYTWRRMEAKVSMPPPKQGVWGAFDHPFKYPKTLDDLSYNSEVKTFYFTFNPVYIKLDSLPAPKFGGPPMPPPAVWRVSSGGHHMGLFPSKMVW